MVENKDDNIDMIEKIAKRVKAMENSYEGPKMTKKRRKK